MRFENKIGVVIGGAGGMGSATSKRFAAEGGTVVICDMAKERGEALVEEIVASGGKADFLECNVSDEERVAAMFAAIEDKYDRLDIAINNFGGPPTTPPVIDCPGEKFRAVIDSYLIDFYYCMKHEAKLMVKNGGGAIVSISSNNAFVPSLYLSAYCAAKAGLESLTKCMAMEVGPLGVRVNTVQPGFTRTPPNFFTREPEYLQEVLYKTPTRRVNTPEDIAAASLFLVSDDAYNITGTSLCVDGGEGTEGYPDVYEILQKLPRTYDGPELGR